MSPADGPTADTLRPQVVAVGLAVALWAAAAPAPPAGADNLPSSKPPDAGGHARPLADVLTPAALRDKLKAKATFDPKSGELTLTYDFATADQLQDFTPDTGKPKHVNRTLVLEPGVKLTHVVQFKTLTLTAVLGAPPRKGVFLSSPGVTASIGGSTAHTLYLEIAGEKKLSAVMPKDQQKGATRIGLAAGDGLVTLTFGSQKLGKSASVKVGRVAFHGGEQGYTFGTVVLAGKVDPSWANDFFAPRRSGTSPPRHP
ncbi:MAG TPA: hypothetical protein VGF55_16490 [Gemmataceae bacterium]|jgi:hypothetical protein